VSVSGGSAQAPKRRNAIVTCYKHFKNKLTGQLEKYSSRLEAKLKADQQAGRRLLK